MGFEQEAVLVIADVELARQIAHARGRDLRRADGTAAPEVYQETYKPEAVRDRFGILAFPWHLIFTPELRKLEAYDLGTDPDEMRDLAAAGPLPGTLSVRAPKLPTCSARCWETVRCAMRSARYSNGWRRGGTRSR